MSDLSTTKKRSRDEATVEHKEENEKNSTTNCALEADDSGNDSVHSEKGGCTSSDALAKDSKGTVKPKLSKLEAFDGRAAITDDAHPKVAETPEAAAVVEHRNVFNTDTIRALVAMSKDNDDTAYTDIMQETINDMAGLHHPRWVVEEWAMLTGRQGLTWRQKIIDFPVTNLKPSVWCPPPAEAGAFPGCPFNTTQAASPLPQKSVGQTKKAVVHVAPAT